MSGLSYDYPAQGRHLAALGLAYVDRGNGSPMDYGVRRARTAKPCEHLRPGGYRLDGPSSGARTPIPCEHPTIAAGECYVEVSAGWMDVVPVSMPCAVAAGWYAPVEVSTP